MRTASLLLLAFLPLTALRAHPQPDIPVQVFFEAKPQAKLVVELDPRCWAKDPDTEPYFTKSMLDTKAPAEKAALLSRARTYQQEALLIHFSPLAPLKDGFSYAFTTLEGKSLTKAEDPVVITATWSGAVPEGAKLFRLEAPKESKMAVPFRYHYEGKPLARFGVLFPGELSYDLDLAKLAEAKLAQ